MRELRAPSEASSNRLQRLGPISIILVLSVLLTAYFVGATPEVSARSSFESPVSPVEPDMDAPEAPPEPTPSDASTTVEVPTEAPVEAPESTIGEEPPEETMPEEEAPEEASEEALEEPADSSSMPPAWDTAATCLSGFSYLWLVCGLMALCVVPLVFVILTVLGANARADRGGADED